MLTINEQHERELYGYIYGLCLNKNCKLFRIGGMPDHIHMLISIPPDIAVSQFVQVLKTESSKWLKTSQSFPHFMGWANGYAVFSYAYRDLEMIKGYIMRQKEHHKSISFSGEFKNLLVEHGKNPDEDRFLED
ncbi:MAG: IS200/IS605 family transposase [Muribaculaceae bacterium]|nr:IS200/IS605 family transposase [Muribaculaceae bacterium]